LTCFSPWCRLHNAPQVWGQGCVAFAFLFMYVFYDKKIISCLA